MKKKLLALSLVIGLGLSIVGCNNNHNVKADETDIPKQFEVMSKEVFNTNNIDKELLIIVKHKETGKKFVIFQGYRKGGICPLD
mgnify:CR=1 FL=1